MCTTADIDHQPLRLPTRLFLIVTNIITLEPPPPPFSLKSCHLRRVPIHLDALLAASFLRSYTTYSQNPPS